jgi:hypothetical protein
MRLRLPFRLQGPRPRLTIVIADECFDAVHDGNVSAVPVSAAVIRQRSSRVAEFGGNGSCITVRVGGLRVAVFISAREAPVERGSHVENWVQKSSL